MTSAAKSLLADIQSIAPDIAARAAEIEAGRGIPIDLVEALRSVGVFRLLVPRSHGGLRGPGRKSLASRRYWNAEGRGCFHAGHAGRNLALKCLHSCRRCMLCPWRRQCALRDLTAAATTA